MVEPQEVDFTYGEPEESGASERSMADLGPDDWRQLHFIVARETPELAEALREGGPLKSDEPLHEVMGADYGLATRKVLRGDLKAQYAQHLQALETEKASYFTPFQRKPAGPIGSADAAMIWMGYQPRPDIDVVAWAKTNQAACVLAEDFLERLELVRQHFDGLIEADEFAVWAARQPHTWRTWRQISEADRLRLEAELEEERRRVKQLKSDLAHHKRSARLAHDELSRFRDEGKNKLRPAVTALALLFFRAELHRPHRLRVSALAAYLGDKVGVYPDTVKAWLKDGAKALDIKDLELIGEDELPELPDTFQNNDTPLRPARRSRK